MGHGNRRINYAVNTALIVDDLTGKVDDLRILYKGEDQKRLAVSRISVWNGGNEALKRDAITPLDPLRISLNGAKILDVQMVHCTKSSNQVSVVTTTGCMGLSAENHFCIVLDYLDPGEGAVFKVVHDGSKNDQFTLEGTVIGPFAIFRSTEYEDKTKHLLGNGKFGVYTRGLERIWLRLLLGLFPLAWAFSDAHSWWTRIPAGLIAAAVLVHLIRHGRDFFQVMPKALRDNF